MKDNRNMYYGNYQAGGVTDGYFNPPSGYNINSSFSSFGPNNMMPANIDNGLEERLSRIERNIRNLDQRLERLENIKDINNSSSSYMI